MIKEYFEEVRLICDQLVYNEDDRGDIQNIIDILSQLREDDGRLFVLGVGGSAANASHAVNDFRKLCGIRAYTPTDNVAELTARTNDEGWEDTFVSWLDEEGITDNDAVLVLSVGGGNREKEVSMNIVKAIDYAAGLGAKIIGIVGRDGGFTKEMANACILIPTINPDHVTPHSEAFQAVLWHLIVWNLKTNQSKW